MLITEADDNWVDFDQAYSSFYFGDAGNEFSKSEMVAFSKMYASVTVYWSVMNYGYRKTKSQYPSLVEGLKMFDISTMDEMEMWLLYGFSTDGFYERLISIMVENRDTSLVVSDYALLLYISYQEPEVAEDLKKIPFYLLHDMFDSVAEANVRLWLKG
jgi:hypothetical protein